MSLEKCFVMSPISKVMSKTLERCWPLKIRCVNFVRNHALWSHFVGFVDVGLGGEIFWLFRACAFIWNFNNCRFFSDQQTPTVISWSLCAAHSKFNSFWRNLFSESSHRGGDWLDNPCDEEASKKPTPILFWALQTAWHDVYFACWLWRVSFLFSLSGLTL